jgi:high-affinity Fe2+/Pb2+ permease
MNKKELLRTTWKNRRAIVKNSFKGWFALVIAGFIIWAVWRLSDAAYQMSQDITVSPSATGTLFVIVAALAVSGATVLLLVIVLMIYNRIFNKLSDTLVKLLMLSTPVICPHCGKKHD